MSERTFPCGHRDYGTEAEPASCYGGYDPYYNTACGFCDVYYCRYCDEGGHTCGGCGENYRHGRYAIDHPVSCTD